ncbi:CHASE2 domain-containing protein [Xanthobacter versatilis]|uniref:CHASE2 domain-containing protein n=1 Tax=Xanthobacter autotrophicus (strain ATCC BAA-1158 / Py2) TaxID=78245 RepID=UPI003727CA41
MKSPSRWIGLLAKPAIIASIIGFFSFFGLADQIAGFSANLGEKDRIVRWSAVLSGATRDAIPVTLIDIDAAALAALGHPQRAPRDLVAGLLSLAAAKQASGIFLDMDTSQQGSPSDDQALLAFISTYPQNAPPLALARRLGPVDQAGGSEEAVAEQPSILDATVRAHANILWAASISRIDEDRVVRRWELSRTFCTPDGGRTLPSPQLFAAAVASAQPRPLSDVQAFVAARTRAICGPGVATAPAAPPWPRNPDQRAAIAFLIADGPDLAAPQFIRRDGRNVLLFRRVSARALMTSTGTVVSARAVADDLLRDRFVIIGASHAESMDGHLTPIGFLPGALIVANAVATAPAVLSGQPLGAAGVTLIALALFGALMAITSRLRALAASVVVAVAVLGSLMALGRIFAPSTAGDIVLAALGMVAFLSTLEGLYTAGKDWRARGWRALLKPEKPRPAQGTEDIA